MKSVFWKIVPNIWPKHDVRLRHAATATPFKNSWYLTQSYPYLFTIIVHSFMLISSRGLNVDLSLQSIKLPILKRCGLSVVRIWPFFKGIMHKGFDPSVTFWIGDITTFIVLEFSQSLRSGTTPSTYTSSQDFDNLKAILTNFKRWYVQNI